MKLFLLSGFGMMVAMSVAQPKSSSGGFEAQLKKLEQLMDRRLATLNNLLSGTASADEDGDLYQIPKQCGPLIGLQTGTLGTGSIQPACGLQSRARGLTAEADWRRMFPHKPGYSR